ncbi:hypothetical protein Q4I32_007178 [Leishmania shawi]|uniref:Uncharacterized protein n=1 Tax=Leishmania shawi TaxID=5680 RepID=A0AAW3B8X3_9TRYP
MMANGDYTYINDLDDGGPMSTTLRLHEQSSSLFVGITHDSAGESQSQYDYLDGSLAGSNSGGGDGIVAALALEDFLGVDGSNLTSVLSESNSVFDIDAEENNTQTQTPSVASRSVSGADFNMLPMAPTAKQPIEKAPGASASAPHPAVPNSAVLARHLNLRINTVIDLKRPSTLYKYYEIFGGASSPAGGHNHKTNFSIGASGSEAHHRSAKDTSTHRVTNATVTAAGKGVMATDHTSKLSALLPETAAVSVPTRPAVPPAPSPLHPLPSVAQPHNGSEVFSFGIDTFLHGNQLGFGRQPSFKRLTPVTQGESRRPYFLLRCKDGDTSSTTTAGAAAAAVRNGHPAASASSTRVRAASVADRSAEAFSTWLEALESKATGLSTSARSGPGATHVGSTIGENFKREVDVLMKSLFGDYDVFPSATTMAMLNNPSASGVTPSLVGGSAPPNRRRGSSQSGPGDSQPADLDAFLGDVHTLTSSLRPTTVMADEAKRRPSQSSVVSFGTSHVGSSKLKTIVPMTATDGSSFGGGGEKNFITVAYTSTSATALASPQPPIQGNATKCRRRVWNTSLRPNKSSSAMAAMNGDVVLDPTATAVTEALWTMTSINATTKPVNGRVAQCSSVIAASQSVEAMTRVPPRALTGATRDSVVGGAKLATVKATTASAKTGGIVVDVARVCDSASSNTATPYPYIDEDLLAGGYITGPPQLVRSPVKGSLGVLLTARVASKSPSTNNMNSGRRSGSYTHGVVAPTARGCCSSQMGGHISASQQQPSLPRPKLHPLLHSHPRGAVDGKVITVSDGTSTTASGAPQQALATYGCGGSRETPTSTWNYPYGRAATSSPPEPTTAGSGKTQLDCRSRGDSTLGDAGEAFLSIEEEVSKDDLTDNGGMHLKVPLPPTFLSNDLSAQQGMAATNSTASADATGSHSGCVPKSGGSAAHTGCTRRSSLRPVVDLVTMEPIALMKGVPIPSGPSSVSRRGSASQTEREVATSGEHGAAAATPRRRLMEFRNGDYTLPAFSPTSCISATVTEDSHSEAVKQRDRDWQVQQANEERRQRIQAFMSRRKAEKQLEEQRQGQMSKQEGQLQIYREMQGQQSILGATPHLETSGTVGSGVNVINVPKHMRKSSLRLDRPVRQEIPAASFSPDAAMASTVSSPHIEVAAAASADTLPAVRRGKGKCVAANTNVRAVVVFTSSAGAENNNEPMTLKDDNDGRRCRNGRISLSTAAPGLLNEGTVVVVKLSESCNTLKVQQPQECTRFFSVDEFLRINDAVVPKHVERPFNRRGSEVVTGVLSNGALPRRRLSSLTLTEMNRKFLAGVNVALLLASTEKAHYASLTAIREVVEGVLSHMPPQGELFASIAFVVGGNTQDMLSDSMRAVRSTFSTSPLFGATLDGVAYVAVTGLGHLSTMVTDAYKRCDLAEQQQQPNAGLLVMSLLLKQPRGSDVVLSSYLITDAGCDGSTYVAVLRKAQHTPFALFHSALGGPTLTTALVSVDVDDTATVMPLLNMQHRLTRVTNKPCHVGSVRRFLELAQQELQNRAEDGKPGRRRNSSTTTTKVAPERRRSSVSASSNNSASDSISRPPSSGHRGYKQQSGTRAQLHKRLLEEVATAQSILNDPANYRPKALREASHCRHTSALTSMAHASASSGVTLLVETTLREQRRSVGDDAIPNLEVATLRKRLSTLKAADCSAPATADTVMLPFHGSGAARAHRHSPSPAAVAVSSPQLKQLLATRCPSGAPNVESDANATATPLRSPPTTCVNHQIVGFRPLQQSSSPLAGRNSVSMSMSAGYVRRGNDGGVAPHMTGFMNFEDLGDSTSASVGSRPGAGTLLKKGEREESQHLPLRPAAAMATKSLPEQRNAGDSESSRRGQLVSGDVASGSTQRPLFVPPGMANRGVYAGHKVLRAPPTRVGSNGPHSPSIVAMGPSDTPIVPSVAAIDSSLAHDVSVSVRQSSTAPGGEKESIPTSTKVRTLVIVDPRCRDTSNVTYDNTMVIATTEDDFEEYDVDEVREVASSQEEPIQAELLTELCETVLLGGNAAILGADSRPTAVCAKVLKSVVQTIFADMNHEGTHRSGHLSTSIVKVKGESVVDLLKDSGEAQKLVIAISPLFGSCIHGVIYSSITNSAAFNTTIDAALHRAASEDNGRDYSFLFCSLIFKLQLEEEGDVLVCSLVATFAGENVGLYTSVLDRSPLVPRALFHYALGGPSYTIALLGIGSKESRANQMLQVQQRLGEVSNRATHPGSVAKFVAGIRNDLTPNLIAKYESSRDQDERAATKEMIGRLAEMVKDADALLHDFDHHQPKAYLHEDQERDTAPPVKGFDSGSPAMAAPRSSNTNSTNVSNLTNCASAAIAVTATPPAATSRPAAPRALPYIMAANPEDEGVYIQSLVCCEQVLMGAGSVAVQGNSILCTSQGGMRYDSDEVIVRDEAHRSLSSKLMNQLVAKFLAGYHTGLLTADSSYSAFTPLMLRCIVNSILDTMLGREAEPREGLASSSSFKPLTVMGELRVSIALIKDEVTADLLPTDVDATYHRFEMEHMPLYGPRIVGVTSHLVSTPQDFDHFLSVAIDNADPALQSADPGIMVVSLTLTQRVSKPTNDVLVSSLLCTAVFDAVHHYERVLEGDTDEPLELFHNILRGPCFTVALLGISDEEENPGKLLRALHGITQARNRPPEVNSVLQHIQELQRGVVKLNERMATSSNEEEKEYILSHIKVAEHLLADAEALQRSTLSSIQPRTFVPLGGAPDLRA